MGIEDRIRVLLGQKIEAPRALCFDSVYHEQFEISGLRKAAEVLDDIQRRNDIDLSKCAYFSIGGSTGSEIYHVLNNSSINCGVLLEYSPDAMELAHARRSSLSASGKDLVLITGDATQQLGRCKDQLLSWHDAGRIGGVIVSAQAVLHELPTRSPGFDLGHFIGEVCWQWDPFLFFSREPCSPVDWPEEVEIHVPGICSTILEALATEIQSVLRITGVVRRSGPEWVSMSRDLAVETVTKVFYLEDYQHEIQERVTSLDPNKLRTLLENLLGENSTTMVRKASESFVQRYRELGIQARKRLTGEKLFIPETFARVTAERVTVRNRKAGNLEML
jgi:hypothetical protein